MKRYLIKILLSIVLYTFALQSTAQDILWYQPGHEWFYKTWCSGAGSPGPCGYSHYTVESEVIIGGKEATALLQSVYDESGALISTTNHFFRTSGDSVFHYFAPSEIWYLLYSFNTPVGESWIVQDDVYVGYGFENDLENWRFEVVVDSITTADIGGISRRKVHTSPWPGDDIASPSTFYFSEGIVEGIGSLGWDMFGEGIAYIGIPGSFSCFIENNEIIYGPFGYPCTSLSTTENVPGTLAIFPNPATDRISIALPENPPGFFELRIYDFAGRPVHTGLHYRADQSIDLPGLSSGFYIVQLRSDGGLFSGKLVVNR